MSACPPLSFATIAPDELPEPAGYSSCRTDSGLCIAVAVACPGGSPEEAEDLGRRLIELLGQGLSPDAALAACPLRESDSAVAATIREGLLLWAGCGDACICGYRAGGCRILARQRQYLLAGDRLILMAQRPSSDELSTLTAALAEHADAPASGLMPTLLETMREQSPTGAAPYVLIDYRPQSTPSLDAGNRGAHREVYVSSVCGDREDQQDCCSYCCEGESAMVVIADGAGGHAAGALASRVAVDSALCFWNRSLRKGLRPDQAEQLLTAFMQDTNRAVCRYAREPGREGNGRAAMVFYYQHRRDVYILHIGDCRAYTWTSEDGWTRLTDDDSELELMVKAGELSPEEAWRHPGQNRLLQALGAESDIEVHYRHLTAHYHQVFLLCCDGFWNQLHPSRWQQEETYGFDVDTRELLQAWVKEAAQSGEGYSDNVTAALIVPEVDTMPNNPLWQKVAFIVLTLLAIALGTWYAWSQGAVGADSSVGSPGDEPPAESSAPASASGHEG